MLTKTWGHFGRSGFQPFSPSSKPRLHVMHGRTCECSSLPSYAPWSSTGETRAACPIEQIIITTTTCRSMLPKPTFNFPINLARLARCDGIPLQRESPESPEAKIRQTLRKNTTRRSAKVAFACLFGLPSTPGDWGHQPSCLLA